MTRKTRRVVVPAETLNRKLGSVAATAGCSHIVCHKLCLIIITSNKLSLHAHFIQCDFNTVLCLQALKHLIRTIRHEVMNRS